MTKKLLILGGGTAGTMMANHLRRKLPSSEWEMAVADRDDVHYYQPGYLFLLIGMNTETEITRQRSAFLPKGVDFVLGEIETIRPGEHRVALKDGRQLAYDVLIDFNYDIEPHEGGFPFAFGPMRLLEESRLNHWGKMAFRLIYWHMLLKGRPLPGIHRQKKIPQTV